ncbi:MAG: hypothetical protein HY287_17290 [Planctomycetes bacterium]|nr:hypothetical protein [Planctomycetota bacterium]
MDGPIIAWGADSGLLDVPDSSIGYIAAAIGYAHGLGLQTDGSIVGWGDDTYGQADDPVPNTGFVTISAGLTHSLALRADGTIVAWGDNEGRRFNRGLGTKFRGPALRAGPQFRIRRHCGRTPAQHRSKSGWFRRRMGMRLSLQRRAMRCPCPQHRLRSHRGRRLSQSRTPQ